MSIVLFVSASAFTSYLTDAMERGFEENGYDIVYSYDPTMYMTDDEVENGDFSEMISHEALSKLFEEAEAVTNASYVAKKVDRVMIDGQEVFFCAVFVEDDTYEAFLEECNLDIASFANSQNPKGVAIDGNTFFDYEAGKFVTKHFLDSQECEIVLENDTDKVNLSVGAVIEDRPYFVSNTYELSVVYPYSLKETVLQNLNPESSFCDHYILSENHKASYEAMKNTVVEQGLSKKFLTDYAEAAEENRTLILIVNVFAYGFIVLISLIAAANVFNTVSTNISLRRREFAMLKSVGMSSKEMSRMMNFECVLYGSRALLCGLPVSALITWFIYHAISNGFTIGFYLPWGAIAIAVLSVFAVVFATMMYSMRKIQADNPIDALKNENL